MKKRYRIKDNREFQHVFKNGRSFANRQLVLYYIEKPGQEHFRIGLSVGKKIGNAVLRNRIKRFLRQAFLELEDNIEPANDIIIIARHPTRQMSFNDVKKSLIHLLSKKQLLAKK
ncbi:ribonuclease P protein component [Lentibacillus sp. CBA3610]|uniref:ribonuclease P protein component n=1 Tax=Lentibacillus sp. CBA3610 TaxID=2518176 RepID=UPI001595236E|nr:ribonuclease P protein component [Lentibacillus sp. CBA3610]QKY70836.1 ribonuclease P protein component [Lentibacillus sp. CBA3610]